MFKMEDLSSEDATNKFNEIKNNVISAVSEMQSSLSGLNPGEAFEGENAVKFAETLNEYAKATGMTAD
jgi:hypothetical protein